MNSRKQPFFFSLSVNYKTYEPLALKDRIYLGVNNNIFQSNKLEYALQNACVLSSDTPGIENSWLSQKLQEEHQMFKHVMVQKGTR